MSVVIVGANGVARLLEEAERVAMVKARGVVPSACGDSIPEAPARGAFRVFDPVALYPDGSDYAVKSAGYRGRKAIRLADAFDKMEGQARKVLFEPHQKAIGRSYGALFEKLDAAGVRCSSVEAMQQQASSGGGEYMDALLRDRQRLDDMQDRVGYGVALSVRRIRPSARGKVGLIKDRSLIDMVCVQDLTLSEVLKKCGWVADGQRAQGKHIKSLRLALLSALDRMAGVSHSGHVAPYHSGAAPGIAQEQWRNRPKNGD
ncbi:hypothetical protein EPIB2_662 [Tritonibacter mobilis]|uniref:hypothetical protein n=1 Tax=Tritonibacter mobilis TaxID=379347 RepID=UPI000F6DAA06|nr:hypothetical protein [Tritonibacter mobilis]VCU61585.1 hypothetical protein EPIB2_662 [Tritonibacter mobilis]